MSLNQVLQKIKLIGESHKLITSYYFGDVLDYTVSENARHGSFVCSLLGGTVVRNQCTLRFGLSFFDWIPKGKEVSVWSDQLLILQDVVSQLSDPVYDWDISESAEVRFFTEDYEDSVSGVQTEIKITFDYEADRCAVPIT